MIGLALAVALTVATPASYSAATIATPVLEYQVPENEGWVTDLAKLLSPADEKALEARLESWTQLTGHQIAVLTIPSLEGESLEQASLAVARAWGIGTGKRNDGALLFVSQQDRKMRIEVGNGLEGALPDSIAGRVIRDVIAPKFRAKRFGSGIRAGVEAMISVIDDGVEAVPALQGKRKGGAGGVVALLMFALMMLILVIVKSKGGGRGRPGSMVGPFLFGSAVGGMSRGGGGGFSGGGGGFSGFGGGGFSGGGASGGW